MLKFHYLLLAGFFTAALPLSAQNNFTDRLPQVQHQKIASQLQRSFFMQEGKFVPGGKEVAFGEPLSLIGKPHMSYAFFMKARETLLLQSKEMRTNIYFDQAHYEIKIFKDIKQNLIIDISPQGHPLLLLSDWAPIPQLTATVVKQKHPKYINFYYLFLNIAGKKYIEQGVPPLLLKQQFYLGAIYIEMPKDKSIPMVDIDNIQA